MFSQAQVSDTFIKISGTIRTSFSYQEGFRIENPAALVIGRARDTRNSVNFDRGWIYKDSRSTIPIGRVFYPEGVGENWTLKKNAAYFAGAIESGKTFIIVTPLEQIYKRATDIFNNSHAHIGYTGVEILWLQDNGYTFEALGNNFCRAIPPRKKTNAIINYYGYPNSYNIETQVERLKKISECTAQNDYHWQGHKSVVKKDRQFSASRDTIFSNNTPSNSPTSSNISLSPTWKTKSKIHPSLWKEGCQIRNNTILAENTRPGCNS